MNKLNDIVVQCMQELEDMRYLLGVHLRSHYHHERELGLRAALDMDCEQQHEANMRASVYAHVLCDLGFSLTGEVRMPPHEGGESC